MKKLVTECRVSELDRPTYVETKNQLAMAVFMVDVVCRYGVQGICTVILPGSHGVFSDNGSVG